MKSRVISRYFGSHSYFHSFCLSSAWNRPKFIDPMLSDAISGLARSAAASRSSSDMPWPPPVVMLTTALVASLICGRNCMNTAGSGVGRPSLGLRACKCSIAAPALAAPMAPAAISSGVIGRYGVIDGVWIEPVTAQEMMTLRDAVAMLTVL